MATKAAGPGDIYRELTMESTIAALPSTNVEIDVSALGQDLLSLFENFLEVPAIILAGGGQRPQLMTRRLFLEAMGSPYGRSLYLLCPISVLLQHYDCEALCRGAGERIVDTAEAVMARRRDEIYEPVLVCHEDGRYGVLDIRVLLTAVTHITGRAYREQKLLLAQLNEYAARQQQMLRALERTKEDFRNLIDGPLEGVMIHSNFRIRYANSAYAAIFGFATVEDLMAQPDLLELCVDEDRVDEIGNYASLIAGQHRPTVLRVRGRHRTGATVWLDRIDRVINWQDETAVQISVIDVTERVQAEIEVAEKSAQLSAAFDTMADGICLLDGSGAVMLYNARFMTLLGLEGDAVSGASGLLVLFDSSLAPGAPIGLIAEFLATRTPFRLEAEVVTGTVLVISGSPRPDGSFVLTFTDITDRKRAECDLLASKEGAEQALARLQAAQDSLIQSESMASLGRLVAGVAHEINTPVGIGVTAASDLVRIIQGLKEDFERGTVKKASFAGFIEEAAVLARIINDNLQRAADLVRSFKRVAVDQTSGATRPVRLCAYLGELALSLSPKLKQGGHRILIDGDTSITVEIDPGNLSPIVTNLVVNAVMHGFDGRTGGTIAISVARDGERVVLSVADDGVGMTDEVRERIFDPFFTTRRSQGGTGLGMHILFNLVDQKLHGQVTYKSAPGEGTTMTITFPATRPA